MSTGPWKSKQPEKIRKEYTPADAYAQLADLLEQRSAKLQTAAQMDGEISARVRTIGVRLGAIPLPPIEEDEPDAA
jgi:hypothetical protein